jgi:hypothetical protein
MISFYLAVSPIMLGFGALLWIMIFLESYRHFPKMSKTERMQRAVTNATIATIAVLAVVYASLYFTATHILGLK